MTLLVYCAWETRVMRNNVMMGKKAALRVLQDFWSSIEEDRFEAQVLDCVSIILNTCLHWHRTSRSTLNSANVVTFIVCPSARRMVNNSSMHVLHWSWSTSKLQRLGVCVVVNLAGQPSSYTRLTSVNWVWKRQMNSAKEGSSTGIPVDQFTSEQMAWIMGSGAIRPAHSASSMLMRGK